MSASSGSKSMTESEPVTTDSGTTEPKRRTRSKSRASIVAAAKAAVKGELDKNASALPATTATPIVAAAAGTAAAAAPASASTVARKKAKRKFQKKVKEGGAGKEEQGAGAGAGAAGAAGAAATGGGGGGGKRKKYSSIKTYIYKLWRQRMGNDKEKMANKGAMVVLQDAVYSVIDRVCMHVQDLKQKPFRERMPSKKNKKQINARDIKSAFQFIFSRCQPHFYNHFVQRGAEAVKHHKAAIEAASATATVTAAAAAGTTTSSFVAATPITLGAALSTAPAITS